MKPCTRQAGSRRSATPTAWRRKGRMVFTGGMVGWTGDCVFETDDFTGQAAQALQSTSSTVLACAGARPEHIVRLTWYVTDKAEYLGSLREERWAQSTRRSSGGTIRRWRWCRWWRWSRIGRRLKSRRLPSFRKGAHDAWTDRTCRYISRATGCRRRRIGRRSTPRRLPYPDWMNAAVELTDAMVAKGFGDHTALIGNGRQRTYKELADWTNRIAHALVEDYGVKPGNRVLIRSANNPAMVAAGLAATKAGAVVVNTMPMLRAGELGADRRQGGDQPRAVRHPADGRSGRLRRRDRPHLKVVVGFDGTANHDAELDRVALRKSGAVSGRADRSVGTTWRLLGFTSGTTGEPKATMHFHRDLLIIADGYAKEVLGVTPDDVFVGSPPLAFTFGLGGLAIFPLRFGAAAALLEQRKPPNMIAHHPGASRDGLLHRAHCLPGDAEGDGRKGLTCRPCARQSARGKPCPRRSMRNGSPRPASRCWTGSARPRCCTSS